MKNRGTFHSLNRRPSWGAQRAFTIIELVSVMILIGVMAAVALPRFADNGLFASAGFSSELKAALKHARKSAVAMRRNVCVSVAANALTFTRSIDPAAAAFTCAATTLPLPGQSINTLTAPSGVGVAVAPAAVPPALAVVFDGLGRPLATATFTVTASDGSTSSVVVEAGSGYVH